MTLMSIQNIVFLLCFNATHDCLTHGKDYCVAQAALAEMGECPPLWYFEDYIKNKRSYSKSSKENTKKKEEKK